MEFKVIKKTSDILVCSEQKSYLDIIYSLYVCFLFLCGSLVLIIFSCNYIVEKLIDLWTNKTDILTGLFFCITFLMCIAFSYFIGVYFISLSWLIGCSAIHTKEYFLHKQLNKFQVFRVYDLPFNRRKELVKSFDLSEITGLEEKTIIFSNPEGGSDDRCYLSILLKNEEPYCLKIGQFSSDVRDLGCLIHRFLDLPAGTFKGKSHYSESIIL